MATKKTKSKAKSAAKKAVKQSVRNAKKGKYGGIVAIVLVLILGIALFGGYQFGLFDDFFHREDEKTTSPVVVDTEELSVHFLELGNWYTGDCTYIKIGTVDILIDAGSRASSAQVITEYVNQYCTDGVLEYVIATHAHRDHIAGFVGTKEFPGIFEQFECETIIDFPRTDAPSQVYRNYCEKRDAEVAKGAKHYTALECYENKNGAKRKYTLAEGVELEILYQKFYEEKTSDENNYSVCCMINQGNQHYLFTGDLEGDGEESLVQMNNLPHCTLFKAGHHGSGSSTKNDLLKEITPEVVCVCCCAGSDEFKASNENRFPTQEFCTRVSEYTDKVYVTSLSLDNEKKEFTSMNGNIVFSSKGDGYTVRCSASDTLLKDTEWFKKNRVWGEPD